MFWGKTFVLQLKSGRYLTKPGGNWTYTESCCPESAIYSRTGANSLSVSSSLNLFVGAHLQTFSLHPISFSSPTHHTPMPAFALLSMKSSPRSSHIAKASSTGHSNTSLPYTLHQQHSLYGHSCLHGPNGQPKKNTEMQRTGKTCSFVGVSSVLFWEPSVPTLHIAFVIIRL